MISLKPHWRWINAAKVVHEKPDASCEEYLSVAERCNTTTLSVFFGESFSLFTHVPVFECASTIEDCNG